MYGKFKQPGCERLMKKLKHLYLNFIMTFSCKLNCTYCTIPLELRRNVEFLGNDKIKLSLFQAVKFFKDNDYDLLTISITGDELENIPNFLERLQEILAYMDKTLVGIPAEKVQLKMHTNLNAKEDFYLEQFDMLEDAKRFCRPEFETVYQAMYHKPKREGKLNFIREQTSRIGIDYLSSIGLRNEDDRSAVKHLYSNLVFNFDDMPKTKKLTDREMLYIIVATDSGITNGCGFEMSDNLFKLQDRDFCSTCPHETCVMLDDLNKL